MSTFWKCFVCGAEGTGEIPPEHDAHTEAEEDAVAHLTATELPEEDEE